MPEQRNGKIMLTEEEEKTLTDLGKDLTSLETELRRAERAGIDVSTIRGDFEAAKRQREGLLREYTGS